MPASAQLNLQQRLQRLETHLAQENPILLGVVKSFRALDRVAYGLGLMASDESYATRVPWWPLISVLGTFSSGKSTFINDFLGRKLQLTGNQAVDDKFTVVCFSNDETPRVLPGLALDADPRFPFYNISNDIEAVAAGEGRRVDAYIQLKTCPSERLRGKIVIDSPGFDADLQRTSTLRITDHIIDLSDLVLVFFDARHPEPGAMKDTLQHLVSKTISRPDSNKFLYILNQIDATAREDNPEEVFAAWQRSLASAGLTAGRFYRIYNLEAANPIEDTGLRKRFEAKREVDMAEVLDRMQQVEVERAYRIIGVLEKTAKSIQSEYVPRLREARKRWKAWVLGIDALVGLVIAALVVGWGLGTGWWQDGDPIPAWFADLSDTARYGLGAAALALLLYIHHGARRIGAKHVLRRLGEEPCPEDLRVPLLRAFRNNRRFLSSVFSTRPVGWGRRAHRAIARVMSDSDRYVETLNDRFTNPSGNTGSTVTLSATREQPRPPPETPSKLSPRPPLPLLELPAAARNPARGDGADDAGADSVGTATRNQEERPRRRLIHFEEP
ncbi:MAG: dynamin family protein [Gammaproteobacteria bacterium]